MRSRLLLTACLALGLGALGQLAPATDAAAMACDDPSNLCAGGEGVVWESARKATEDDRIKRSKSATGTVSMTIDGGRGSLFINGRYAGSAPLEGAKIPAGPNDIQVRDGMTVLATGVLTVPSGGNAALTVNHP